MSQSQEINENQQKKQQINIINNQQQLELNNEQKIKKQDIINDQGQQNLNQQQKKQKKIQLILRIVIVIVLLTLLITIVANYDFVYKQYEKFILWFEDHVVEGFFMIIVLYIICTICFIPGSILTLGAGYCFYMAFQQNLGLAILLGVLSVFLGSSIGSMLAMLLGRYVFRNCTQQKAQKWIYFRSFEKAVLINGFKFVLLLRLSPLTPYNVFNYFCGVTSVKFQHYAMASVGMLPATTLFVYFGTMIKDVKDIINGDYDGGMIYIIFMIIGSIIGVIVIVYIGVISRKQFLKYVEEEKENKKQKQKEKDSSQQNTINIIKNDNNDIENNNNIKSQKDEGKSKEIIEEENKIIDNNNE